MDAKELRLGNLVYAGIDADENPLACVVKEIANGYIKWGDSGGNTTYINCADPIPLTPELLEKIGFERIEYSYTQLKLWLADTGFSLEYRIYKKEVNEFVLYGNGGYDEAGEMSIIDTCKFIHQLQNLYFSLTGKELEINLNQ